MTATGPIPGAAAELAVEVRDLHKDYALPRESLWRKPPQVHALRGVSLSIEKGRSFGIVGESGSGKSTLARLVMGLEAPTRGSVRVLGHDINEIAREDLRRLRRNFQMVFQDPFGSLDPRQKVGRIVAEPMDALERLSPSEREGRVAEVLEAVGLKAADTGKYPHEFSGGQRQRIAIARALATRPAIIVADEPVSALDVSVQAQVLNLLQDLQDEFGITYLLISHDLAVVEYVCDVVAVMHDGLIVEHGAAEQIFTDPQHDYTKALLAAVPNIAPAA
jgi:peptide/nickel transport system ATP-binding protein